MSVNINLTEESTKSINEFLLNNRKEIILKKDFDACIGDTITLKREYVGATREYRRISVTGILLRVLDKDDHITFVILTTKNIRWKINFFVQDEAHISTTRLVLFEKDYKIKKTENT